MSKTELWLLLNVQNACLLFAVVVAIV